MKQKLYNYVRNFCKILIKIGYANCAKFLLGLGVRNATQIFVLRVKNITTSKDDKNLEFLWNQREKVPVYDYNGNLMYYSDYESWVVKIQNCHIYSGTSFILDNRKKIAYADLNDNINVNHNHAYGAMEFHYKDTGILMFSKNDSVEIQKGIFLCGKASFNYYHLMIEIFPRFYFLAKTNDFKDYPLLIDEVVWHTPQFKEALSILNNEKREIILIKKANNYTVGDLIIPSDGSRMPIKYHNIEHFVYSDCLLHIRSVLYIRDRIKAHIDNQIDAKTPKHERIFITRKTSLIRRPCNENDLWNIAKRYGFESLAPEDFSFLEQVYLFAGCQYLVCNSGGGLTNLLFMQKNTNVLYWISETNQKLTFFINLAKAVECNISFITGKPIDNEITDIHGYFYINPSLFNERVETMLN